MIRFVDLRGQMLSANFAFYNTVTCTWVEYDGCYSTWESKEEFATTAAMFGASAEFITRCLRLCPDWVPNSSVDEHESTGVPSDSDLLNHLEEDCMSPRCRDVSLGDDYDIEWFVESYHLDEPKVREFDPAATPREAVSNSREGES